MIENIELDAKLCILATAVFLTEEDRMEGFQLIQSEYPDIPVLGRGAKLSTMPETYQKAVFSRVKELQGQIETAVKKITSHDSFTENEEFDLSMCYTAFINKMENKTPHASIEALKAIAAQFGLPADIGGRRAVWFLLEAPHDYRVKIGTRLRQMMGDYKANKSAN